METKVNMGAYYSNDKPEVQQVGVRRATDTGKEIQQKLKPKPPEKKQG